VEGLAIAGVLAMWANALATLAWARLRHGAPRLLPLVASVGRTLLAAVPAAWAAQELLLREPGRLGAAVDLALGGGAFLAIALAGMFAWGDESARGVFRAAAGRLRGRA
jgi:hypothetical protein